MNTQILLAESAFEDFLKLEPSDDEMQQVKGIFKALEKDPFGNSVIVPFKDFRDIRVTTGGGWRVLYQISPKGEIVVLAVLRQEGEKHSGGRRRTKH